MFRLQAIIVGALLFAIVGMGVARAAWVQGDRFHRVDGTGPINTVVFRGHCLDAEDSAAYGLVLRSYSSTTGIAVYGCKHRGY